MRARQVSRWLSCTSREPILCSAGYGHILLLTPPQKTPSDRVTRPGTFFNNLGNLDMHCLDCILFIVSQRKCPHRKRRSTLARRMVVWPVLQRQEGQSIASRINYSAYFNV